MSHLPSSPPLAARSLRIDSEGLALHLLERHPGAPHRVLLLHGYLDHARSFDWLVERLPSTFHTVALDLRGMGHSGHLGPGAHYHLMDHLADLGAVLDGLGWTGAHLVGHSLGGILALAFAAARPDRVRSVTAIEALGPSGGEPSLAVGRLQAFVEDAQRPARRRVYADVAAAAARLAESNSGLSPTAALHLAAHGTAPVDGGLGFTFDPRHRRRGAMGFDEAQTLALLAAVSCSVQVVLGTLGYSAEDAQAQARLSALRAPPVHRVPGGHHCHMDSPSETATLVQAFVSQVA